MERMAQKMKKHRLTNNLGLKIIALFSAALLGRMVVDVSKWNGRMKFSDSPVTSGNDDIIKASGDV